MSDRIFSIGESGIEAADERVKSLMSNMVNAETPGFRKSDVVQTSFPLELAAAERRLASMRPEVESAYYDYAPGALIRTGNSTDLAIGGDGFFVISTPWGESFTRDGRFALNKDGQLVTVSGGHLVLGKRGPIIVPAGSEVEVTNLGEIKVDGATVDSIRIADVPDKGMLEAVSGSVMRSKAPGAIFYDKESPNVVQGYVESSNVSMVDEMMNLVMVSRLYGINVKVIQARDANLSRAVEMGRPLQ